MPDYEVETSQGKFRVTLKDLPKNAEELSRSARELILSGAAKRIEEMGPILTPEGAEKEATRLSMPESPTMTSMLGELASFGGEMTAPAILPTLGQSGGAAVGGLVTSPSIGGVPAGVVAGEAIGGGTGETLNQLLGITEPSAAQIGLAGASGPAGRAIGGVLSPIGKRFLKRMPGTSVVLQEEAVAVSRGVSKRFAPIQEATELFGLLENIAPKVRVDVPNLSAQAEKLLRQEKVVTTASKSLGSSAVADLASDFAGAQSLSIGQLRGAIQRLGQRTGAVQGLEANELRGAYKSLVGAIEKDLDGAISAGTTSGNAAAMLKNARNAFRRERAILDLGELIESGVRKGRSDLLESFNPAGPIKNFKSDKFRILRESFTAGEQTEIISILKSLKGLPALPTVGGAEAGSARVISRAMGGGLVGTVMGLDPQMVTALGLAAGSVPWMLARVSTTDSGRRLLRNLLQPTGFLDHRGLSILLAFVRSQTAERPGNEP